MASVLDDVFRRAVGFDAVPRTWRPRRSGHGPRRLKVGVAGADGGLVWSVDVASAHPTLWKRDALLVLCPMGWIKAVLCRTRTRDQAVLEGWGTAESHPGCLACFFR